MKQLEIFCSLSTKRQFSEINTSFESVEMNTSNISHSIDHSRCQLISDAQIMKLFACFTVMDQSEVDNKTNCVRSFILVVGKRVSKHIVGVQFLPSTL